MLALKVVTSRYPIEVERGVAAAINSIHRGGGLVTNITVLGDITDGFVASIVYDDGVQPIPSSDALWRGTISAEDSVQN